MRFELTTYRLQIGCAANCATSACGRELKIRTLTNAFGERCATITPIPYIDPSAFARVIIIPY